MTETDEQPPRDQENIMSQREKLMAFEMTYKLEIAAKDEEEIKNQKLYREKMQYR